MDHSGLQTTLWAGTAPPPPETEMLTGARHASVLIIGGGFTGCSAALHLAQAGTDVVVLEGSEIGFGASGRNVGMVNASVPLNPKEVLRRLPEPHGERFLDGLAAAPSLVRSIAGEYGIDCHICGSGIVKIAHSDTGMAGIRKFSAQWQARGAAVELMTAAETTRATGRVGSCGGMIDRRNFLLQPLSYVRGLGAAALANGAKVFTGSRVVELSRTGGDWVARTASGSVTAQKVLICTGAYSTALIPGLARSFTPVGCFLLATSPLSDDMRSAALPERDVSFIDSQAVMQFARYDHTGRLIVGTLGWLPQGEAAEGWARKVLQNFFPQLQGVTFDFAWTGNIDLTDDHLPWLAKPQAGLFVTGGFNGRGIATGTYLGKVLASWIGGLPESELPLPVKALHEIPFQGLKKVFYSKAFNAYRVWTRYR